MINISYTCDKYLFTQNGNSYQVRLSPSQLGSMTQCVIIGTQPHGTAQRLQSNEQKQDSDKSCYFDKMFVCIWHCKLKLYCHYNTLLPLISCILILTGRFSVAYQISLTLRMVICLFNPLTTHEF